MAKLIICARDNKKCNLNEIAKECRFTKDWDGRCNSRIERKFSAKELDQYLNPEDHAKEAPVELMPDSMED